MTRKRRCEEWVLLVLLLAFSMWDCWRETTGRCSVQAASPSPGKARVTWRGLWIRFWERLLTTSCSVPPRLQHGSEICLNICVKPRKPVPHQHGRWHKAGSVSCRILIRDVTRSQQLLSPLCVRPTVCAGRSSCNWIRLCRLNQGWSAGNWNLTNFPRTQVQLGDGETERGEMRGKGDKKWMLE